MANITFDTIAGLWETDGDWIGNVKPNELLLPTPPIPTPDLHAMNRATAERLGIIFDTNS